MAYRRADARFRYAPTMPHGILPVFRQAGYLCYGIPHSSFILAPGFMQPTS